MELIDSHCHLDDYDDLPDVLKRAHSAGVAKMLAIGIGNGPDDMHRALEIAREHAQVFASAGIHPQEALRATPEALAKLETLARDLRCLAVGEIGLDYYHLDNPEAAVQQDAFIAQMKIAAKLRKPIIIHCRTSELAIPAAKEKFLAGGPNAAWDDLLALLVEHWAPTRLPGIMHCFSGSSEQARRSLEIGFYLSFAGNVTYAKSVGIQEVARWAPARRILVETDAPFLAPGELRGKRCEPAYTALTAKFVAGLRGVELEELAAQTTANFGQLFPASV